MKERGIGVAIAVLIIVIAAVAGAGAYIATRPQPEFQVENLSLSSDKVAKGEPVSASVNVANVGDAKGTHTVSLEIGDETLKKKVTLKSGESQTVSFDIEKEEKGTHNLNVGDSSKTLEVVEPAEFEFSNLEVNPKEIVCIENTRISVDVKNTGEVRGTSEITLKLDGEKIDSKNISLSPKETKTVSFTKSFPDISGQEINHKVEIGNLSESLKIWKYEIVEVGTTDYIDPETNQENPPETVFTQGDTIYYYAIWRQYSDSFKFEDTFRRIGPNQSPSEKGTVLSEGSGTVDFTEPITWNSLLTDSGTEVGTHTLIFSLAHTNESTDKQIGIKTENTTFEIEPLQMNWREIGRSYEAADGLTVTLESFDIVEKTGSYQYNITYKLANETNSAIDEGTFKLYGENDLPQYGFFDRLFPGDTITRSYTFEEEKHITFDVLAYYHNQFFADSPPENALKWKVKY